MTQPITKIPISSIILDEDIYPRKGINPRRVGIFAGNIRDGFNFEPIEVEPDPDKPGRYRLLDGAHRWGAYKTTGVTETEAVIKNLDGEDPQSERPSDTHIIQAPMSAQGFSAVVVSAMQKRRILDVTSRYVIVLKQPG